MRAKSGEIYKVIIIFSSLLHEPYTKILKQFSAINHNYKLQ